MPSMPLIARLARLFLADAVRRLSESGVRQFLDIGSGVPTADNTHQVAQRLAAAARTLDLTRPVGVLLIGVLHFIPDSGDPGQVVARLMAGLPSGSYLAIAHAASDLNPEAAAEATRRNNQTSPVPISEWGHGHRGRQPSRLQRHRPQVVALSGSLSRLPPGGSAAPSAGSCRR
jgi:hypothetical protein